MSNSEPIAMISAAIMLWQWLSRDSHVNPVKRPRLRTKVNDHEIFFAVEGEADETQAGHHEFGFLWVAKSEYSPAASIRRDGTKAAIDVERKTLRPAESGEEPRNLAAWGNPVDCIEARCCWSTHV